MKTRIVQRTDPSGKITFEIQRKHRLFRWLWIDAWIGFGPSYQSSFNTYEKAVENLWKFDGSLSKDLEIKVFE